VTDHRRPRHALPQEGVIDAADALPNQSLRVARCFDIPSEWPLLPRRFAWISGEGPGWKRLDSPLF